jgi:hypothetical protein
MIHVLGLLCKWPSSFSICLAGDLDGNKEKKHYHAGYAAG